MGSNGRKTSSIYPSRSVKGGTYTDRIMKGRLRLQQQQCSGQRHRRCALTIGSIVFYATAR